MSDTQMTLVDLLKAYIDELIDGDVPEPLRQRFTLAAVVEDLCRLAGLDPAAITD